MQRLEILVTSALRGTGFGVILATVGRTSQPKKCSLALGIATVAGPAGQMFGAQLLLQYYPRQTVFGIFAIVILLTLMALPSLKTTPMASKAELHETLGTVLIRAIKDPSFSMIFLGFFSCGYQLGFITAHFPAFVTERYRAIDPPEMLAGIGITSTSILGATSISVIGLFNIAGSLTGRIPGKRYSKKYLLAGIYTGRTVASALFIMLPMTPTSVPLFSAVIGAMWLASVPLTSGLVAHMYGIRYYGHALWVCVPKPPDWELFVHLAGRQNIRPDWGLHDGLVDWHWRGSIFGADPPADPGTDKDTADGVTLSPG